MDIYMLLIYTYICYIGTPLVIGGVTIPYKLGADAHSDGDAIYHRFTYIQI